MSNNENNVKTSHSSHHRHSHSSSGKSTHHHHRSKSDKYYKSYHNKDISSEMERRGENIIYDKVRKERISLMIKRSIFCLVAIALIFYVVYSMTGTGGTTGNFDFFNRGLSTEEINEMKMKIIDYEQEIEELKERLSKYENVESNE